MAGWLNGWMVYNLKNYLINDLINNKINYESSDLKIAKCLSC